ncbi:MAG: membrane protease YdiL (CAAX protease family), partial [Planctomycetota bacterium]
GYALRRLEEGLGTSARGKGKRDQGTLWAVLLLSTLFGLAHAYRGWTGQLETGLMSLALFGVYFAAKRDLGVVIVAHATVDAIGFWFLWQAV